jgi:hypothetical protein
VPNWIYCSPMVPQHAGVECGLLAASNMGHEFSNEFPSRRCARSLLGARIEVRPMDAIDRRAASSAAVASRRPARRRKNRRQTRRRLGSAVVAALLEAGVQQPRLALLSVSELPGSGTTAALLAAAGLDAMHIASAAAASIGRTMRNAQRRNPRGERKSPSHHNRLGATRCL